MTEAEQRRQDYRKTMMLTESLPKIIIRMAAPSIVSFLITSIYNLADTFFVSSLGTNATAAVSVNASLDQIIMMAGSMLAVGAASYISRLLGARKEERASRVFSVAFFSAMAFGAVVMVLGLAFMRPMVRLLGATDTCEQYAAEYASYVLLAAPFMAANFVMNQCLRAEGSAMLSMIGMGFGGILNCFLDPLFICLSPRLFRPDGTIVGQIVSVGSSSLFRNGLAVISAIVLNRIAGGISDSVLAGIGVSTKVMMFPFGVILGFGTGFQPVAGFNWGAKRYDRVEESYRFAARTAVVGAAVMGVLLAIFAEPLITLFAKADPEMQAVGALAIRLQCLALPAHSWVAVVNMLCAGLGKALGAVLLSTARQGTCFLPIVYPMTMLGGANGVAAVQAVADVLSIALAVPLVRRMKAMIRQAAQDAALRPQGEEAAP